ncbi:MAG: Fe-S cluster assembly protein SufD [Cyanophyceae cyanobacterium]
MTIAGESRDGQGAVALALRGTDVEEVALGADRYTVYLRELLARTIAATPATDLSVLGQLRTAAIAIAQELAWPSTRDEAWRFTNLAAMMAFEFGPTVAIAADQLGGADPQAIALAECPAARLVFVNGYFCEILSDLSAVPAGVTVERLATADLSAAALGAHLGKVQNGSEPFAALNTAAIADGAVVRVARNAIIETPIQILFLAVPGPTPALIQPRVLVVAEEGSACTLIEDYALAQGSWCQGSIAAATEPYFTNGVTEIAIADNARINHSRIQREAANAFHIGKTAVLQGRDSYYGLTTISTGAAIARHNLDITQGGPGTETRLQGLTVAAGTQIADLHSDLNLQHPHGVADQLHKCIAANRGRTVFNGRVLVGQKAQHTDAAQLNRNLLLSSQARVDTKPQLEIIADDVKCTHGATVSQLEDDEIFYLRSRGLDSTSARRLLLDGFGGEILAQLPAASLRSQLARCLACELEF